MKRSQALNNIFSLYNCVSGLNGKWLMLCCVRAKNHWKQKKATHVVDILTASIKMKYFIQ